MALPNKVFEFPKYEDVSTEELVQAQAHIWNHMFAFINSMSLKCAIQLGIPDIIHTHGKPITLSQLVYALRINITKSGFISRLMRILTYSKFFVRLNIPRAKHDGEGEEEKEEDFYWLTPASYLLLKDGPLTLAPFVQLGLDPIMTKPFNCMSESIVAENHVTSFEMAHGTTLWELAGQELSFNDMFNCGMSCDARFAMHVVLKECRQVFEGIELLVDVGGGDGTTVKTILQTFPDMKCLVLDLPNVVAGLEESDNITYVVGDMFESIPPRGSILLKWILHDWNDEESIKILKNCKQAITKNGNDQQGKVIIMDMVFDDFGKGNEEEEMQARLLFDIAMMAFVNGRERTKKEWTKLFIHAGFSSYKFFPSLGVRSLIELYP